MKYLNISEVVEIHDSLLEWSGGLKGTRQDAIGYLDSVLDMIQIDDYYHTFVDKTTYLFYNIIKNHSFVDGNKRTSVFTTAIFLDMNSKDKIKSKEIEKLEALAIQVAENTINKEQLKQKLKRLIDAI